MRSGLRHCESFAVLDAHAAGEIEPVAIRRIGPDLVFARLWRESGMPDVLRSILKERQYEFDVEREKGALRVGGRSLVVLAGGLRNPGEESAIDRGPVLQRGAAS